ncbi:DUF3750 domain-containing protein [Aestuariibacter sp. A3R04]|uniref:DUF3750 domain-containing protein n=1 Tax=Aestuariibacter sp. A3R04 TaxID=2841571 RepID=UPI001C07F76D|nr:DUF3750 domain-containing protein [Aestuariibacter sp. A3R04]MBU3020389.1 DUF3750 domain-containing protein [Aestuariibacter sp. A3R04]
MFRLLITTASVLFFSACSNQDWRTASREPAGIAFDPSEFSAPVIEVYAADAFSWRGWFAVHTWIALKEENETLYTVYEVVGWRVNQGLPALKSYTTATPDRYWYGAKPEKVLSVTGEKAKSLIPKVKNAISNYPWANEYTLFPGPNSNTFPAWVGVQVPELELKMPFSAIGAGFAD